MAPGGRLRNDSDAAARRHHGADGVEAVDPHAQPQRAAEAGGLHGEMFVERGAARQADEVEVEQFGKAGLSLARQPMAGRHRQHLSLIHI